MEKRIIWHVEKRRISDLKPYDKNPRVITEDGLGDLKKSFDEIGMAQPININLDNTILSGHARWNQLKIENPDQEIDVYVPDRKLTPKQEEAVIIRMNKNIAGLWDKDILANQFELSDLREWGFQDFELDDSWTSDIEAVGKIKENNDGISGVIKISCNQEDREELELYLKDKIMETGFSGVTVG